MQNLLHCLYISSSLMLIFQEVYSASDLDDGIKLPSKEEIFGRVHEITAQYQDENEKIMQQIKDHQVSPNTISTLHIYLIFAALGENWLKASESTCSTKTKTRHEKS